MSVIILIRRVAKTDCVEAFLKDMRKSGRAGSPASLRNTLPRIEGADMPGLRELGLLHPSADGIAFLNVAFWKVSRIYKRFQSPAWVF